MARYEYPDSLSGSEVTDKLNDDFSDILEMHRAQSRPTYISKGHWIDVSNSPKVWNYYDGAAEIKVGEFDETNHTFTADNAANLGGSSPGDIRKLKVVESGTFNHTGGGSTTQVVTLSSLNETDPFIITVHTNSDPAFNADYEYSYDFSVFWDESAGQLKARVDLTWSIDPGSGNDVEVKWRAIE